MKTQKPPLRLRLVVREKVGTLAKEISRSRRIEITPGTIASAAMLVFLGLSPQERIAKILSFEEDYIEFLCREVSGSDKAAAEAAKQILAGAHLRAQQRRPRKDGA